MKISVLRELRRVLKVAKKEFWNKFLISIFLRGLLLIIPVLFSQAINLATKQDYRGAIIYIILSIVVTVVYRISEGINQRTFYQLYNRLNSYFYEKGINITKENSIFSLSRFNLGQYTNMLTSDVDVVAAFFANGVIRFVQLLEFVVIYIYFWSLDIVLFLSAIAISMIVLIMIPRVNRKVEKLNSVKKEEYDKEILSIHEFYKNIKEIKCFNIFDKVSPITTNQADKYLEANAKHIVTYTWNNQFFILSIEIFRLLSVAYGIFLITQGSLEIGALLIIYNYYQKIIDNFSTILTIGVEFTNLKVSLERLNHLVEYTTPPKQLPDNQSMITSGKIEFHNILYGYKNDPTLKNVSFTIEPNALTVITGKANTGKTGIFDLLLKLNRQHEGTITIDGHNINDIPDSEYFSKITLLRKDPTLFTMSIKDNFALVESDPNKMVDVCMKLGIHNDIIKLPHAYNTILGEHDGLPMSLKQLIATARTILKGSQIMLFDEAFVGLDNEAQDRIMKLLLELKKDHTIVMISHERNVLKDAEKVIVMDNKQVVESGTLQQLIENKGKYYTLFEKPIVN